MEDCIKVKQEGGIVEITLERPPANAINLAISRAMGEAFMRCRDDDSVRVVLLRTESKKFFCAGWDLKAAATGEGVDSYFGVGGFGGLQELSNMNKPVIAMVEGMAVGGGFELALSADLIYATEESSFALPEINVGILADAATCKLPKRIPYHIAMEWLLTGRWITAAEAARWGVVCEVLKDGEELLKRGWEIARLLAAGPPLVFAAIKEVTRETEKMSFQEAMNKIARRQFATVDILYGSEDNQEGLVAFAEKRKPQWKGDKSLRRFANVGSPTSRAGGGTCCRT